MYDMYPTPAQWPVMRDRTHEGQRRHTGAARHQPNRHPAAGLPGCVSPSAVALQRAFERRDNGDRGDSADVILER